MPVTLCFKQLLSDARLENQSHAELKLPTTLFILVFPEIIRIQIAVRSAAIDVVQNVKDGNAELECRRLTVGIAHKPERNILEQTGIPIFQEIAAESIASETAEFRTVRVVGKNRRDRRAKRRPVELNSLRSLRVGRCRVADYINAPAVDRDIENRTALQRHDIVHLPAADDVIERGRQIFQEASFLTDW